MVNELLQRMIMHSYNTVPYYKEMFNEYGIDPESIKTQEDLVRLPVLTKEQIQENPDKFISSNFLGYPQNMKVEIRRTSGSTGKFLKIYWSIMDDIRSKFHLWNIRKKVYGVDPADKFCSFHTTLYINNRFSKPSETMLFRDDKNLSISKLNLSKDKINEFYHRIVDFKPKWMFIQPSIAYMFAEYIIDNELAPIKTLKYIELTGEYLFENMREKIQKAFKVNIANQYGCNEVNGIAFECTEGNLHCLENNVIVEVLNCGNKVVNGKEGDIYITGLTNTAMPFIRYAIGDRGVLRYDSKCLCGKNSPVLELSTARVGQYILGKNGEKISYFVFLYPIETLNSQMGNPISQFQIIQNGINEFLVRLKIENRFYGWRDTICKEFIQIIKEIGINKNNWTFEFVDSIIPNSDTGKLQFFINNVEKRKERLDD